MTEQKMEQIELVVKIPKDVYEDYWHLGSYELRKIISNGTPLPKGHGALKDVVKIEEAFWNDNLIAKNMDSVDNGESQKMRRAMIRTMHLDVPTIIEADKEGVENGKGTD